MQMKRMDVDSIMVKTRSGMLINKFLNINVNGSVYHVRLMEYSMCPYRVVIKSNIGKKESDSSPDSEKSIWEDEVGIEVKEGDMGVGTWESALMVDGMTKKKKGETCWLFSRICLTSSTLSLLPCKIIFQFPTMLGAVLA